MGLSRESAPSNDDVLWQEFFNVELEPNPQLTEAQRRGVARDYGMSNEKLVVPVRCALLYYFNKRLRFDVGDALDGPHERPIVIANRTEFDAALRRATARTSTPEPEENPRRTARSVSIVEDSRPFAKAFSRLYELKDAVPDSTHPDAYFQNFEKRLEESEHIRNQYMNVERPLEALDQHAWHDMLKRAAPLTVRRHATRGWQSLFDTLNEAKAYAYLQRLGCSDIAFIERASKRTPDLRAVLDGRRVLCEAKTVNLSQDETDRRDRIHRGEIFATSVEASITSGMLNKVTSTLVHAIEQLDHEDPNRTARRFVFTVLHFDDWVGAYQTEYIAQLDAHLAANPITGAELLFCPASDLFQRRFMMRSATVVEI